MADDIDIEEHDILDNPRIQDILHIKEEPIDLDSDVYDEPTPAYEEYNNYENDSEENYEHQTDHQIQYYQEPPPDMEINDRDIEFDIPGAEYNEPEKVSNESILESDTEAEYMPDLSNEIYHHNNKIILGTKPCKRPTRDINGAYVDLEDWSVRLETSHCYCKECQILFATRNALDAHNMIAHSFLVALDSPENSESEVVESETPVPEKTETAKYCDHCKKYFPSDHALIQHLYDLITANKTTPVKYRNCTSAGKHMVYSCLICNMAYLDMKWFRVHMRTFHKTTEVGNYEHIPFTGICKICKHASTYLKRFNCHVKTMHLERNDLIPRDRIETESSAVNLESHLEKSASVNQESQPEGEESQSESVESESATVKGQRGSQKLKRFKCIKCKTFYSSIDSIKNHQRQFHRGENIIKKLGPKSIISKKVQRVPQKVSAVVPKNVSPIKSSIVSENINFVDNLVPKNSVFKCNNCGIHFVTCWAAILHVCVEMSRYQCDICCKQFRLTDSKIHHQQHIYNDAFNTYYITKNMNTKMMFWCQKCAVYFELNKFQNHLTVCDGTSSSVRCIICEIDVSDILTHMQNHKLHNTKSDFIYIDDLLPGGRNEEKSPEKDLKRKLPMEDPGPSKVKKLDANKFMYCNICNTCMKQSIRSCHATGECKKIKGNKNCAYCGLVFFAGVPMNSHETYHRIFNPKFSDFTFVKVSDQTPTVPLMPEFPKCEKCDTHDFSSHKCGSSKSCKICNKKFSESVLKLHLLHHEYLKEDAEVNELIKKYETLASTWNILYVCKTCNVATDTYDDVVVHCQNHYNNIKDCASRKCDICCLKLEDTCYKRHTELHSAIITRKSFKTVVYDYRNLLNDDWLKLFGTLSNAEVHQVVTRSIYVTRFVKMKLILDGPPELTIYKCETCKLYVDPHAIYNHTTLCVAPQDFNKKSYSCETCLIPFSTATARKDHEKLHATPNITANSFRIVAFNDKSDREFNTQLQVDGALRLGTEPSSIKAKIPKTAGNVIFYQCRQCKCCSLDPGSLIRHRCLTKEELVKCKKCQLYICATNEKDHRKWHKQNANITKEHINVLDIDNRVLFKTKHVGSNENKTPKYKLYQCKKCKICYSFWVKHPSCCTKYRRCKKCGYLFSYSSYVTHNMWHEKNKNATKNDIKVVPLLSEQSSKSKIEKRRFIKGLQLNKSSSNDIDTNNSDPVVYQCHICKLCSYTIAFVKKHTFCSKKKKDIYSCSICNLKFKYFGMKYHKAWHRENQNVTRDHIKVLPFKGMKILKIKDKTVKDTKKKDSTNDSKKDSSRNIVSNDDGYHCKKCGASSKKTIFLNKHKCKTIAEKSKTCPFVYYQCEDCDICVTSKRHYCVPAHRIRVCPRCKLKFSYYSLYDHMKKHAANKNMTRSKIKVIPFRKNLKQTETVVATIEATDTQPLQKMSTVYRCSCGLHFISQKTIETHFTVCSPDHDIPSENCSKCGLLFPTNHLVSHLCNHHSYGKGNIEVKTIPTLTYYRCGSCKCLFTNEARLLKHNKRCDSDEYQGVRCDECDLDFHETEIRSHSQTHKTASDLNNPCRIVTVNKNIQKVYDKLQTKDGNELETTSKDEPNSSNHNVDTLEEETKNSFYLFGVEYNNCLYKCKDCGTHYLKFDSYLRHLNKDKCNNIEKPSCKHCGLGFTKVSLTRHMYVHHENLKLKLENFNIITLGDPATDRKYLKEAGLIQYKIAPSVSKIDDKCKDNKVELFRCHICNAHFLKAISLRNHILSERHTFAKSHCPHCGIEFHGKSLEMHITAHHESMKLGRKDFRIVEKRNFERIANKKADERGSPDRSQSSEISEIIEKDSIENEDHGSLTKDDLNDPLELSVNDKNEEEIIYYHCVKCKLHFMSPRSLDLHFEENHKKKSIETCDLCGLTFNSMAKHKHHHEDRPSGVFFIQDIDYDTESVNKLFRCDECGLHFMKPQTLIIHINNREQTHRVNKYWKVNCPECGLLFSQITLKLHQALHHGDNSLRLEDIVVDTSIGNYRPHRYGSDDNNMVSQSSLEDVTIEADNSVENTEEQPETSETQVKAVNKSPESSTKLYKCGECNVYFLTQATCYKHIIKHIPMDPKEYIECKLCSFQFRIVSLNTHIRKHHQTDFAFDKVLIEEYQPKMDEDKVPKIDIYYAKDKVQSRLISTTTDDINSAEISQSEIDPTDEDPEASNDSKDIIVCNTNKDNLELDLEDSNDSKDTIIICNTDNDKIELDSDRKQVMVKIPSFTEIKEESDCEEDSGPKTDEEAAEQVPITDAASEKTYACGYCSETFLSRRAKDFHESLDHLDAFKACPICKNSFNTSVLNELHLQIKDDMFTCCLCSQIVRVNMLPNHSYIHKHML